MPGKLQLFMSGEDAQPRQRTIFRRLLHEHRFGKIHFSRDRLHCVIGQAVTISEHRKRIPFEPRSGENV